MNHVRKNVNPALWAETFADDEDFYEAGYQPGNEVELFASDEAGQLAKRRLAVLEKYELAEARVPREDYSLAGPHQDLLTFGQTVKKKLMSCLLHLKVMGTGCLFPQNPHQR